MTCVFLYWFRNVFVYEYEFGLIEILFVPHTFIIMFYGQFSSTVYKTRIGVLKTREIRVVIQLV